MKCVLLAVSLCFSSLQLLAASPSTEALREELKIKERVMADVAGALNQQLDTVSAAWTRVDRESSDMMRAHEQGEDLASLRSRDQDLRLSEAALAAQIQEAQRLRRDILRTRLEIDETKAALKRLEEKVGRAEDPLTGNWHLVMEPGGQEGFMSLQLNGTLVEGTYQLSGGWTGSLRGTLVAGKVRLERVDSQIGFAAVLYAKLSGSDVGARLDGHWEATQLATGLPSSGTWVAQRVEELPE